MEIDLTTLDTLTVRFFREKHGPLYKGSDPELWGCLIGHDYVIGIAGFGLTPLLALQDLCENIGKFEGFPTDNKKIFIR